MLTNVGVFTFICLFNLKLTTPQSISSTSGINLIQTIEELEDEIIKLPDNVTQFTYYNTKIRGVCPKNLKGAEGIKCEAIESQCYCFIWNPRKSWWDARNFCRHHGMDLVSFETPEEENRVALKVFENFKDNVSAGHVPPGISFFSSGQRKYQKDSQYFYFWSSTGTIIPEARFTGAWHIGEPTFKWEGEAENCIQWHVTLGSHPLDTKITWNDHYYCCPDENLISDDIRNQLSVCHSWDLIINHFEMCCIFFKQRILPFWKIKKIQVFSAYVNIQPNVLYINPEGLVSSAKRCLLVLRYEYLFSYEKRFSLRTFSNIGTQDAQNRFHRYFESGEPQVKNGMSHIHEVGPYNPIVVKCYLTTFRNEGIEIRRFFYKNPEDPTIQKLKACCKILYPQLQKEEFELMYLDEDNDKVALSTDPELEVIWLETKSSGQQLRLYIHVI